MPRIHTALLLVLLFTAACGNNSVRKITFEGETSEHKWTLHELNPQLPSDWTGYNYLVLEMKASSPQRFGLTFYSGSLAQRRTMHPMAGVWIRASGPLQERTMA